jgi:hypothetical protein
MTAMDQYAAVQPWRLSTDEVFSQVQQEKEFGMAGSEVDRLLEQIDQELAVKRAADNRVARVRRRDERAALRSLPTRIGSGWATPDEEAA